jgi:uncharacterized membrane protein
MVLVENYKSKKLSTGEIILKSSVVGVIVAVPTIIAFLAVWNVSGDLLYGAITGLIVNFIAMAVSFKIVKKFFVKTQTSDSELP